MKSTAPMASGRAGVLLFWTALVCAALVWSSQARAAPPSLEVGHGGVVLSRLPPILADVEVRSHLGTGLTTTLALRVEARSDQGKSEGGAVVTIRFDLWDEVFHVAYLGAGEPPQRIPFQSFEELETWWRDLRLAVLPAAEARRARRLDQARLVIDVVPFSAAEARDTQRWFSETLDDAKTSSAEDTTSQESSDTLSRTFRLMMATSIQRRSIRVFRYEPEILRVGGAVP